MQEQKLAEQSSPAQRLEQLMHHPLLAESSEQFQTYIELLPEQLAAQYVKRMEDAVALAKKNEAASAAQIDGVLFNLAKIATVMRQGLEQIDFSAKITEPVDYSGFDSKETDFSEQRRKHKQSAIQLDIPITRDGKPYVYEVKAYPRMVYGASAADRNQILKYQQAAEKGIVDGATVEIKGRIDPAFLKWLIGESIVDRGAAADVEVIYCLELPSGAEYRFVLNGNRQQKGLRFQNEHSAYTKEDQEVVSGIFRAILDHSIIRILASNEVNEPSAALQPLLDDPYQKITTKELYKEYSRGRTKAMHEAFRKKNRKEFINTTNDRSSLDIVSHTEEEQVIAVSKIFDTFQESLQHDPELKNMKDRYAVTDPAIRQEIINESITMIRGVGAHEIARTDLAAERPMYKGRAEGVALTADSIVFDAVYNVLRRHRGEATRSYDKPERFEDVRVDNIDEYLATQERVYRSCEIFDPLTGQTESLIGDGGEEATRKIEKRKAKIPAENERRLEQAFKAAVLSQNERIAHLETKTERTGEEARELRKLRGKSTTELTRITKLEREVESRKAELTELNKNKRLLEARLKLATGDEKTQLDAEHKALMAELKKRSEASQKLNARDKQKIVEAKEGFIGPEVWKNTAVQLINDKTQNVIKFIYVITSDGQAIICEEKIVGSMRVRPTHSELARGRNVYGAGEIIFEKQSGTWRAVELNNGSGHYKPSRLTLPYAAAVIGQSINLDQCAQRDTLLRGVATPEFSDVLET